jgi:cytochrome c553
MDMRAATIAISLAIAACSRGVPQAKAAGQVAAMLTFDGATTANRAAILLHGERLSHVLGCRGCHGERLEGEQFSDDSAGLGRVYASNLTRALPTMTDAELERLLRTGRHPKRGDLWIMPTQVFQRLSEADMRALIAHLRTISPSGKRTPPPVFSAKGRNFIKSGGMRPAASIMATYRTTLPPDMGANVALGRYIAENTCSECHGASLKGIPDFEPKVSTPDLDIAGAYSEQELTSLLTGGKGKTKPDLGLMTAVGKEHFGYLTPHERAAVIAYVKARATRPQ